MNVATNVDTHSDSLIKRIFTDPTSEAFRVWVGLVNFWIFVSCIALAGETVEPYATVHARLFDIIEYAAVAFFTIDYLGNLYFAKDRVKYFFSFWGLVDLVSI